MKWWTDLFSSHSYTETGHTVERDDGKLFHKVGNSYFDDEGTIIQKTGSDLTNLNTGVSSSWGDPFGDKE